MNTFKGLPESLKKLAISIVIITIIACIIVLLVPGIFFKIFLLALTLPFIHLSYIGMILKITFDGQSIRIYRPAHVQTILVKDIAFCAVHGLEGGRSLLYCFTRKRFFGQDGVRGIRSQEGFDAIVKKLMSDEGNHQTEMDINFHQAKKIPLSFVVDGEILKNLILKAVDFSHLESTKTK